MLIKNGSKPDKMSDGHRTYSGNDFTTRHWHFGKKSEKVMEGTCLKCLYNEGLHEVACSYIVNIAKKAGHEELTEQEWKNFVDTLAG